ncbi:hypothetical protein BT63DRAFT_437506 [Microthyrium microscopicum]|uniref:DUF7702 domain-containing protein n=1 Tax=Microthyrium microscopicum TaxID=703497 RepID=A0A6A6USK6_9PEZI|nr:hypothetical protein BT63DRAFT_437506 [Microthyrium microscopicum]
MLTSYGKLSIAILIYFILGLPVAIWVCKKQGFGRHAGWFYLLSFALVRINGSSLRLAADNNPSTGLYVAALVFSALGLIPLLLCLNGIVKRINDGLQSGHMPPRLFQFIHIAIVAGTALGIAAASMASSTDVGMQQTVTSLRKASAIILLITAVLNIGMALVFVAQLHRVYVTDKKLTLCAAISTPFLLIRVFYLVFTAFHINNKFSATAPDIYVESFMQTLMEFFLFAIYCAAGLLAPPIQAGDHEHGKGAQFLKGRYEMRDGHKQQQTGVVRDNV